MADEREHRSEKTMTWPFVACAVFECRHVDEKMETWDAVCKIYLQ